MKESAPLASIAAASRVFSAQCATSALNSSSCDISRTEKNSMAKMSSRFLSPFFTILAVFCLLTGRNPFFFSFLKCKICTSRTVTLSKELKMPPTTNTALHFCFLSRMQKYSCVECVHCPPPQAACVNCLRSDICVPVPLLVIGCPKQSEYFSAANRLIGEVVKSRRRPLLGPSPG